MDIFESWILVISLYNSVISVFKLLRTLIQNEFCKVFIENLMTFESSSLAISIKKVLVFCHIVIVVVVFDIFAFIGIFCKDPGIRKIVLDVFNHIYILSN